MSHLLTAGILQQARNLAGTPKIRYIRDWAHGSNVNDGNHWREIKAIDKIGFNHAAFKSATTNADVIYIILSLSRAIDNSLNTYARIDNVLAYINIDLGELYEIESVVIHHYPGRTYLETKTEVSSDGINWTILFDSAVSGTYAETEEGKTYIL